MSLPRHHTPRTCFGSCRKSIRRRCGRVWWDVHSCHRRGICRRICRKDGRLLCQVVYDTLLDRWVLLDLKFLADVEIKYLRMMTRHDYVFSGYKLKGVGLRWEEELECKEEREPFECEESDTNAKICQPCQIIKSRSRPPNSLQ